MTQRNAMIRERSEGFTEGEKKGRAEGRAEALLETARSMKTDGVPVDVISKYTGLTPSEISKI